jgi:hypothetical protein
MRISINIYSNQNVIKMFYSRGYVSLDAGDLASMLKYNAHLTPRFQQYNGMGRSVTKDFEL